MLSSKHSVDGSSKTFGHFCFPLCCQVNSTGGKAKGAGKGSGQGAGRITMQCGGLQCQVPFTLCTVWSFRCGKARIHCPQPLRGASYLYPFMFLNLCQVGEKQLDRLCVGTFTVPREQHSSCTAVIHCFCPKCTSRLHQACSQLWCCPSYTPVGIASSGL